MLASYQIPPPRNWQDFESLCRDLWRAVWNDPNTKKNGRSGQAQHGVDVYGRPNLGDKWAGVQCKGKDNYSNQTLSEKELLKEIEKAKKFQPPLSHWILATTAPKDAVIEQKAREITSEHLKQGLFSVDVWFWSDIQEELDSYKEVAKKHYSLFHSESSSEQFNEIKQDTEKILLTQQTISASLASETKKENSLNVVSSIELQETVLTTEYQAEIDYARDLIQKFRLTEAIDALKHLKERTWTSASAKVRFRLLSNLGFAYYKLERFNDASACFIEALQYNPDDENALVNIGLAYQCLKEYQKAKNYVRQAIEKNPANINAYIILLNTPPYRNSLDKALELVPEFLRENSGIAYNLGWIAFTEGKLEEAISWFETAFKNDTDNNPEIKAALGQFLLPNQWSDPSLVSVNKSSEDYNNRIQRSLDLLTKAWEQIVNTDLKNLRANWILNRGVAKRLLKDYDGAVKDTETALQIKPNRPEFIKHRALLAILMHEYPKAVSLLKSILDEPETPEAAMMLADVLCFQDKQPEAIDVLQNLLAKDPVFRIKEDAAQTLISLYLHLGQIEKAQQIFEENFKEAASSIIALVCEGRIFRAAGNSEKALSSLLQAKELIKPETPFREILELGNEFSNLNEFSHAADCFRIGADTTQNTEQTRMLLSLCYKAGNLAEALLICGNIREKYNSITPFSQIEIAIYEEINDLEKASDLCRQHLQDFPDDWSIKQRLAWNSYRLLDFQTVDSFLETEIDNTNLSLDMAATLAHLLAVRNRLPDSIKLLYEMRRKYYHEADAHLLYVTTFLGYEKNDRSWLDAEAVAKDTAVCLAEPSEQKEWFILDERKDCDINRKELLPSHPLAKRMLGKKVGDTIAISSGPANVRLGTIVEIKSKYVHALHDSMARYEKMFPDDTGLWQIYVGSPDKPEEIAEHSHKVFDVISEQQERTRLIREQYQKGLLTIGAFAELSGRSSYYAWVGLLNNSEVDVWSSTGSTDEVKEAMSVLKNRPQLAADITALHLTFELNLGDEITNYFGKLLISPTTIDLIQTVIIDLRRNKESGYSTVAKKGDEYIWSEFTPEYIKNSIEYLENFLNWVQKYSTLSPHLTGLNMPRNEKEQFREILGKEFFDTIFIVKNNEVVLLTEDLKLRQLAKKEFGTNGTWLQPVLLFLKNKKLISDKLYAQTIVRLACCSIQFVSVSADVLIAAAKEADWRPRYPFTRIIKRLGNEFADLESSCMVIAEFFHEIFNQPLLHYRREMLVIAILTALNLNHSKEQFLPLLRQYIQGRFWLSPYKQRYFISVINAWEKASLIIPYKFNF